MEAFENICEWLENCAQCELYTVSDLHEKMTQANARWTCIHNEELQTKVDVSL